MSNISQWSTSAASNNSAPPDGFPEGQAPSTVNDCAREVMAAVARQFQDTDGSLVTAGTGVAYTITTNNANAALADIGMFVFRVHLANTGAATLNVDATGAKAIEADGNALVAGDLTVDTLYLAAYNATSDTFDLLNSIRSSAVDHDATTNFVADEHVAHAGVSVLGTTPGLAAGNDDLSSNIGLTLDISTLPDFPDDAVDLDVDRIVIDNNGTDQDAPAYTIMTPEIDTTVTGTTDTLAESNFGKIVPYSSTGTITVTLPNGLRDGFWCVLRKTGASGTLTLSATTTLQTVASLTDVTDQYGAVTVIHLGSNIWWAYGDLS
jgi:hypothetical protein